MGYLMKTSPLFVEQAYYIYYQALEQVYLLETDEVANIDDVTQVSLALRRLVTINKVNQYYGYETRILVPAIGLQGNC